MRQRCTGFVAYYREKAFYNLLESVSISRMLHFEVIIEITFRVSKAC